MKVVVIGGGPAGIISAITAAEQKNEVILLEKMNSLGKKLLITGKGRCNITNFADISEFIKNVPENGRFLYSVFNNYTNEDIIKFLNNRGLKTKVERGGRIFPESDRSKDVLEIFIKELKRLKVKIITNSKVEKIVINNNVVSGVLYSKTELHKKVTINCDKVILATGGKSYPITGSTGDGYKLAQELGHSINKIKPSLVPLTCKKESLKICQELQGLSLKNVSIIVKQKDKLIYEDFGEMLFTHFGLSGPIILSASAVILKNKNIEELLNNNEVKIQIDLKPALSLEKLDMRILRDFEELKNKQFKNGLDKLLPQKMINTVINLTRINPDKKVNEITKEERKKIAKILKCLELTISGCRDIEEAIITSGGINIKEINPKTMESKIIKGLYFAGEIIDVDALTGGYNLQIAYSTGYTAGL